MALRGLIAVLFMCGCRCTEAPNAKDDEPNAVELPWREVARMVESSELHVVHENCGRRVFIEALEPKGLYVTLQPRHGDVAALLPKKNKSGSFVKFGEYCDVNWQTATELVKGELKSVTLAHFDRVFIYTKDRVYVTISPTPEGAREWLDRELPGFAT